MKYLSKSLALSVILGLGTLALSVPQEASASWHGKETQSRQGVIGDVHESVKHVLSRVERHHRLTTAPVIVTSAQSIDELNRSDSTGRLLGDLISSALTQRGLAVREIRLAKGLTIGSEGEHLLTRNHTTLFESDEHVAELAFVTTFSEPRFKNAFVTIRAIRLSDGVVLASHSFTTKVPK